MGLGFRLWGCEDCVYLAYECDVLGRASSQFKPVEN